MRADKVSAALGREFRRIRRERELSQEHLSMAAGLSRNYLGLFETGKRNIGVETLAALTQALGITMTELFARVEQGGANSAVG